MTSVTVGKKRERSQSSPLLQRARFVKERRPRATSTGNTDVQLSTNVRGISLIQARELLDLKLSSVSRVLVAG